MTATVIIWREPKFHITKREYCRSVNICLGVCLLDIALIVSESQNLQNIKFLNFIRLFREDFQVAHIRVV